MQLNTGVLAKDLLASIVVFLVALPLCMGVAIASGMPPAAGLITGIIGGILVGLISGSPLQVSGPAAGLSVIVWELVQTHGVRTLAVIVVMAGLVQIAAGLLRLGQWFRAVSPAVIYGMLAGIGALIVLSQFHVMLDHKPRGSGLANLAAIPEAIQTGLSPLEGTSHHLAAIVGVTTIALIVLWNVLRPAILKMVPGALVAVVCASALTAALGWSVSLVSVPANLLATIQVPSLAELNPLNLGWPIWAAALGLALVASAETLLSAAAVDRMHNGLRTKYDVELVAQGVGNATCGVLGALPMTGVIVRSSVNVEAGAQTRFSAVYHGGWILAFVMVLPWVLERIPVASLAAVLVFTGYKLMDLKMIRKLAEYGKAEVAIYLTTLLAIVGTNLLAGVIIGIALSALKLIVTLSKLEVRAFTVNNEAELHLSGAATFLSIPKLASALEQVQPGRVVHVYFDHLEYIDHACLDMLEAWGDQHAVTGGRLVVEWDALSNRYHRRRSASNAAETPREERSEALVV